MYVCSLMKHDMVVSSCGGCHVPHVARGYRQQDALQFPDPCMTLSIYIICVDENNIPWSKSGDLIWIGSARYIRS